MYPKEKSSRDLGFKVFWHFLVKKKEDSFRPKHERI